VTTRRPVKSFISLALAVPLSLSGWLSLQHLLQSGAAELVVRGASVATHAAQPEASRFDPGRAPRLNPVHFCVVCAFSKGLSGALNVVGRGSVPPAGSSSALGQPRDEKPRGSVFRPISRAPPIFAST